MPADRVEASLLFFGKSDVEKMPSHQFGSLRHVAPRVKTARYCLLLSLHPVTVSRKGKSSLHRVTVSLEYPTMRSRRVWTVADFADHMGISHRQAKRMLVKLDAQHPGLIDRSNARLLTVRVAGLEVAMPDIFLEVEPLEFRLARIEDDARALAREGELVASQMIANARYVGKLR